MNKLLVKNITLLSGSGLVFTAGLFYVLITDLVLRSSATWLFVSILIAFGSSIIFLASELAKEKLWTYAILKGSAILLSIGYVVFLFVFKNSEFFNTYTYDDKAEAMKGVVFVVSLILIILGLGSQITSFTLSLLTREEE